MTSSDGVRIQGLEEAREHIAQSVFTGALGEGDGVGCVGLEPEYLIFLLDGAGLPCARLPLEGPASVLSALEPLIGPAGLLSVASPGPPPIYSLADGGRITFEPGGQLEHSTAVHQSAALALADVDELARAFKAALTPLGASLASVGLDIWTDRSRVPQQLRAARYQCMADYLAARSEHGRVMMRHSGSFQVNLDLGAPAVAAERWRLANLLTPVALASFACSPEDGWVSRRARAWQGLDPSRTGFPACLLAGEHTDPGLCYADLALEADVMLFRGREGREASPGQPGLRFRDWIANGHPEHGAPTWEDLEYHLTTLFPEVRLRGFLEIRSADAVPLQWRAAQVVFWCGLLYDAEARSAGLETLEPHMESLHAEWLTAAEQGLANGPLAERSKVIWQLALAGARRLPTEFFRPQDLSTAEHYVEEFVARGRCPADELSERLARDAGEALRWTIGEAP